MVVTPDLRPFLVTIAAVRREQALTRYRADSEIVLLSREIVAERLAAVKGHDRYEPETTLTGGE